VSGRRRVSFNQSITVYACVLGGVLIGLIAWYVVTQKKWPPTTLVGLILSYLTVVIGAGFGLKGYLGGINQRAIIASATAVDTTAFSIDTKLDIKANAADIIKAINERRDPENGVESSGKVPQVHDD
jgi:hypothetical protein